MDRFLLKKLFVYVTGFKSTSNTTLRQDTATDCTLEPQVSFYHNIHGHNIAMVQKKEQYREERSKHESKIMLTSDLLNNIVERGVALSEYILRPQTTEHPGLEVIRKTMTMCVNLTKSNGIKLEPFQLECIRASIISSGERLLGDDLYKFIPQILHCVGLRNGGTTPIDMTSCSEAVRADILANFGHYAKQLVAVIAPRRNGKSKAGKLFVTSNAVCEKGARIVLLAHRLESVLLYKSEIIAYLNQILEMTSERFVVHSGLNEIRIDFASDRRSSFIYFVSGGINVSRNRYILIHTVAQCTVMPSILNELCLSFILTLYHVVLSLLDLFHFVNFAL